MSAGAAGASVTGAAAVTTSCSVERVDRSVDPEPGRRVAESPPPPQAATTVTARSAPSTGNRARVENCRMNDSFRRCVRRLY